MAYLYMFTLISALSFQHFQAAENVLETYIVHVEANAQRTDDVADLDHWYDSFLPMRTATSDDAADQPRMLYRYRHAMTGFAAKLTASDVEAMKQKPSFISACPDRLLPLLTTHSPNFLGLYQNLGFWKASNYGKGVIVGVLDSGIAPDHPSFCAEGIPPPPTKWKGKCELKSNVTCNNKLIGVRSFSPSGPVDQTGHGTHTASTAAGNFVAGSNLFGNANGTAAGIAPLAHGAIYQVCIPQGCLVSDIVAGMDAAISDGVDILSMSLGTSQADYYLDSIAIGAYKAVQKGILVSSSAGNNGPSDMTLLNDAPWILTVGASTLDRTLSVAVLLGNNVEIFGQSAFQPMDSTSTKNLELLIPGSGASPDVPTCDSLTGDVRGKLVVCEVAGSDDRVGKGRIVKQAGGAAMILLNSLESGDTTLAEAHVLPTAHISFAEGLKLRAYAQSAHSPVATLSFKGTIIGDGHAPSVAAFSSRGPSMISPGILKPDVLGPGLNILAAWPFSVDNVSNTMSTFNILSGTSMSCPHLSGVAALLKSSHPDWSPAAIKSAIITTAYQVNLGHKPIADQDSKPANIFAIGSGHVNPSQASNPGLIYDIKPEGYVPYLCGKNCTGRQVGVIVGRRVDCSKELRISEAQLNYPSFSLVFGLSPQTYKRTVTNVGEANSWYDVKIEPPAGVSLNVEPTRLVFSKVKQMLTYTVTFTRSSATKSDSNYGQGSVTWISANHAVRSPVAIIFK